MPSTKAYRAALLHSLADPREVGIEQSHEYFEDGLLVVEDGKVAGYLFQSVMLDQETRPPVDLFEFDSLASRMADLKGRTFVLMCNWCQRVKLRDDPERPFVEGHEYYRRGGSPSVAVFHTICPDCRVREREGFVPRKR